MKYLLDTNAVSEWVKAAPDAGLVAFTGAAAEEELFLSVVTLAELQFGVEKLPAGQRRKKLESWLVNDLPERFEGRILLLDSDAAAEWGRVMAMGQRAGRPMGEMDAWIAASARLHELIVVTRNESDFESAGCETLNPWTGKS
jgi:predicted nucleic acid-binding protein